MKEEMGMATFIARTILITIFATIGYHLAVFFPRVPYSTVVVTVLSASLALFLIWIEHLLERVSFEGLIPPAVGLILGLVTADFFVKWLRLVRPVEETSVLFLTIIFMVVFGYFGLVFGFRLKGDLRLMPTHWVSVGKFGEPAPKILDTSVIIDGRVAEVFKVGLIEGIIVIPRFVLDELQRIADSSDPLKRNRGRRGLEILNSIQKDIKVEFKISEQDFPRLKDVDAKLVRLAKVMKGKIVTNDYNLNKVAEFEGVEVLNINDLARSLKPVVLPDEEMSVRIIREGSQPNQGVGYLDNGTMVVVNNGDKYIGKEVTVLVTSVHQTTAGQMIFSTVKS